MREIAEVVIGIWMFVIATVDWRTKRIPVWMIGIFGGACLLCRILWIPNSWHGTLGGVTVGFACLLLGRLTEESIGYGDGLVILFLGVVLGFGKVLIMVLSGAVTAWVFHFTLDLCRGRVKNRSIAFIPFLCFGYGVALLW